MIFRGGGDCGALMQALDWTSNPLGPPEGWPREPRTVVSIALGSRQPMLIVWGPEQITLYNDGYAAMCGNRHPRALGRPFRDLWFDIWDAVDPIITDAYNGVSTSMEDIEFVMHRNGYPEETHFAFSYTPVRDTDDRVLGMFCACVETTEEVKARRRIAREREQMIHVFEMALGAVAILSGPEHVFTFANGDYQQLVGHRELIGLRLIDAVPEVVQQEFLAILDRVFATGEPYVGYALTPHFHRRADGKKERRVLDFLIHPIRDNDGAVSGTFIQALDVTERADAETEQRLLQQELGHRMKNQLAMVQAIANQTLRLAGDMESARTALNARIAVLARAHDLLLYGKASQAMVDTIVREVVSLHDGELGSRFKLDGPQVPIGPRPSLSLSLLLHELSTNAVKYGALASDRGTVSIRWGMEPGAHGPVFFLEWREAGGPKVVPPVRQGTGTRLLHTGIAGGPSSSVTIEYAPEGVRCRVTTDVESLSPSTPELDSRRPAGRVFGGDGVFPSAPETL